MTLWDPAANALVAVLPPPAAHPSSSPFTRLAFVPGTPYLAGAATPPGAHPTGSSSGSSQPGYGVGLADGTAPGTLAVWNLLTADLWWSHAVTVSALAADPGGGGSFAIALPPMAVPAAAPAANGRMPDDGGASSIAINPEPAPGRLPNGVTPLGGAKPASARAYAADGAAELAEHGAGGHGEHLLDTPTVTPGDARLVGPSGVVPLVPAGLYGRAGRAPDRPSTAARPASAPVLGAMAGGAVLLFDAASAAPTAAWALPDARASALLFALPGTPLAAAGGGGAATSQLLILTHDRRFVVARPPGVASALTAAEVAASTAATAASGTAVAESTAGAVGYEAAFGRLQDARKAGGPADRETAAAAEAAAAAAGSWQSLFDAPSHVLPPLSVLCPAFLELMIGAEAPAEE